jgi:AcrR family transcriptional regulator
VKKTRVKNSVAPQNREPSAPTDKMQAILTAAQRIFTRCGFGQTRVEDIAQEAGVGKGTVYEYFPSKQAIFEQAVETGVRDYLAAITKETKKPGPIEEKLHRIALMHLGFVTEHRNMASLVMSNPAILLPHREKLLGICREAEETVAAVIQEGVDSGAIRPISARLAAQALIGVLSTVGGVKLLEKHQLNVEKTAADLMDIVLHGMALKN